jgi:hypothetical protein
LLYGATGEQAFLATAERMADAMCEAQATDGAWAASIDLTAEGATMLEEMADAVEGRGDIDVEPVDEGGGGEPAS